MWSDFCVNEILHSINGGMHGPTAAHSVVFGSELYGGALCIPYSRKKKLVCVWYLVIPGIAI